MCVSIFQHKQIKETSHAKQESNTLQTNLSAIRRLQHLAFSLRQRQQYTSEGERCIAIGNRNGNSFFFHANV